MRLSLLLGIAFAVVFGVMFRAPLDAQGLRVGAIGSTVAYAQDQAAGKLSVDININKGEGGNRWYANPMWIAIGGLALLLLLVLIVTVSRGGGTTVVK
jgi:hypothetical protein